LHGADSDLRRVRTADPGTVSSVFAEDELNSALQGRDLIVTDPAPPADLKALLIQLDTGQRAIMHSLAPYVLQTEQAFASAA
jgi:hypothetical protein